MLKKNTLVKTAFNEYKVIEQCGQGGNSTVFKVADNKDEIVALKIMKKGSSKDKINRFKNEINFCYTNSHENIIKINDFGYYINAKDEECIFCIMPYYPLTLRDKINSDLSSEGCMEILYNILYGLEFAHNKGSFHRDLKPENILFENSGNIAIISDFGIAHFKEEELIADIKTKFSDKLANANYAAPEQRVKDMQVDGRCDIFALSLILNEMFTKKVVLGANFKKISEVDSEYGFLDFLFTELNTQNANERLYPISKILLELSVLIKNKDNELQLKKLREQEIRNSSNDENYPTPQLSDAKYENGKLILTIKPGVPNFWCSLFRQGHYSHSALMGCEPERFDIRGNSNQIFEIRCEEQTVRGLMKHFKEWLPDVSKIYNNEISIQKNEKIIEEEISRRREIDRIESEVRINSLLTDLI